MATEADESETAFCEALRKVGKVKPEPKSDKEKRGLSPALFRVQKKSMSVFSFKKTDEVWGLNRSITMGMIEWWIDHAGPQPYLLKIKESYDHGYNHGNLAEVADDDKAELRDLVMKMLETGYERQVREDDDGAKRVQESLYQLWKLLNADLKGTRHNKSAPLGLRST